MREALRAAASELHDDAAIRAIDARERRSSWRERSVSARSEALTAEAEATPPGTRASALRGRRTLALALGLGVAAIAGAVSAVMFARSSAAPAPRFIVVQADSSRSGESSGASESATTVASALPSATQPLERSGSEVKRAVSDPATRLADSFRRQKRTVESCVNQHASEAERTPKLSVHIALDASGRVQSARVLPADLANGTMGRCIEQAVRTMQFPRQSKALAFEVPLTARKGD
jgi:hypothetical protein